MSECISQVPHAHNLDDLPSSLPTQSGFTQKHPLRHHRVTPNTTVWRCPHIIWSGQVAVTAHGKGSGSGVGSGVGKSAAPELTYLQQIAVALTQLPELVVQLEEQAAATGWLEYVIPLAVMVCLYAPFTPRVPTLMLHIMPVMMDPDGHCSNSNSRIITHTPGRHCGSFAVWSMPEQTKYWPAEIRLASP